MKQLAFKVFKSKYFLGPTSVISLFLVGCCIYFASIPDKVIYPNLKNIKSDYYTDEANGGTSQMLEYTATDSVISFRFQLHEGYNSPYVGLSFTPIEVQFINARQYNQISLCLSGNNIERIGFSIFTPPLEYAQNRQQDETIFHSYLNISEQKSTYNIPVHQLQLPEWWEDLHQIPASKNSKPDLKRILHINIGSAFSPSIDKEKTLKIYSLSFTRNNRELYIVMASAWILFIILNFSFILFFFNRNDKSSSITIAYQPLDITPKTSDLEKCVEYINNHYTNSNLTLEIISEETATTPRRITAIIHEKYDCNFKTYLNRIRINESKRFLQQTDWNMGEIAFKVGFNSQSHFNRVFKNELQISPTEYREQFKSR